MDRTTEMLSAYTCGLTYEDLGPDVVEQVKRTLVDTTSPSTNKSRSKDCNECQVTPVAAETSAMAFSISATTMPAWNGSVIRAMTAR